MDDRLKKPRAISFGILALAVIASVPVLGWWPVVLLVLAVLGFVAMDVVRRRSPVPEYTIVASWAFAQIVIAIAIAMTGGSQSQAMEWFMIPIVTLPARFGIRGLAAGVVYTVVLMIVVAIGVAPTDEGTQFLELIYDVAALLSISVLLVALMRSDVDHRTKAIIDELTGMLNRRALGQRLDELAAQAQVIHQPIAVLAADIDRFKRVNDVHGHATGDHVLVEIAYRLRKELRAFDLAYRVGGEEFLVVLPGATIDEARSIAENLRAAVAGSPMSGIDVTMSFGVAGCDGGAFDHSAVLAAADCALYDAKAQGRDRVALAVGMPAFA